MLQKYLTKFPHHIHPPLMDIGNVGDGRSGAKGEETCEVKDILKVPPKPLEYTPLIMNEILNPHTRLNCHPIGTLKLCPWVCHHHNWNL